MTDSTNTVKLASDHLVTEEEAAALDFEPMHFDREPDWSHFVPGMVKFHRFAWTILQKTKPQLMEIADRLDNEAGMALLDDFTGTIDLCKADLEMLESALARLMTAVAACAVRDAKTGTLQ